MPNINVSIFLAKQLPWVNVVQSKQFMATTYYPQFLLIPTLTLGSTTNNSATVQPALLAVDSYCTIKGRWFIFTMKIIIMSLSATGLQSEGWVGRVCSKFPILAERFYLSVLASVFVLNAQPVSFGNKWTVIFLTDDSHKILFWYMTFDSSWTFRFWNIQALTVTQTCSHNTKYLVWFNEQIVYELVCVYITMSYLRFLDYTCIRQNNREAAKSFTFTTNLFIGSRWILRLLQSIQSVFTALH